MVREYDATDKVFAKETRPSTIHLTLSGKFKIEEVERWLPFCRAHLDIVHSSTRVHKWLQVVFVEMCSRIKRGIMYNKKRDEDSEGVTGKNLYTKKLNQKRLEQFFTSNSFKRWHIKKMDEIAVAPAVSRASKKRKIDDIGDIDDDEDLFQPDFEPEPDTDDENAQRQRAKMAKKLKKLQAKKAKELAEAARLSTDDDTEAESESESGPRGPTTSAAK